MPMSETIRKVRLLRESAKEAMAEEGEETAMIAIDVRDIEALAEAQKALCQIAIIRNALGIKDDT